MNVIKNTIILLSILLLITVTDALAQRAAKRNKLVAVPVAVQVVDESGDLIRDAWVMASKKRAVYHANHTGQIQFSTTSDDVLVIKAGGYESRLINMSDESIRNGKVVMTKAPAFSGGEHLLYTPFGTTTERRTTGAYSVVKGEKLEKTPDLTLESALGGRLNGLFQLQNTNVPGFASHSLSVRAGWGSYIVMVDGVERSLDYLEPEVIESVELLKDATLKSMYGGRQANGILLVTTKKGKAHENSVRVNVEHGLQTPSRLPGYLNAYDYATYYNQAMQNDGFAPRYDASALDAYKNHTDPILYPDVDYYDMFLNRNIRLTRANAQFRGGNNTSRYFAHVGYQGNGGLEKFTRYPNSDDIFTVRTSVDMDLADFITFSAGFNGALQNKSWPNISTQNFFSPLNAHHANDYPILIPGSLVGKPDKEFVLGGTAEKQNNPYGLLTQRGYSERKYTYVQSDFQLNLNMEKWVPGLSVKPYVSFDVYNVVTAAQGATFSVYEPVAGVSGITGNDTITFLQWGSDTKETKKSRTGSDVNRNVAFGVTANYNRQWGNHALTGLLNFYQSKKEIKDVHESPRRQNLGIHLSDMILDKYIVEVNVNRVGVGSFAPENRYGYFPAFGLGWIVTEESFLQKSDILNYLKLRASYGVLGSTTYSGGAYYTRYHQDVWQVLGTISLDGFSNRVVLERTGNPDLDFQKSYEFNGGFDALLFKGSTRLSLGYFNNINGDQIINRANIIPGVIGLNEALPFWNYNKTGVKGVEGELAWNKNLGDVSLGIAANATYGITKRIIYAEPEYPSDQFGGLLLEGRPVDAILGLEAIGVFADQNDIDQSPVQVFGQVRPGDIKYADRNSDGVVDERDRIAIGNDSPRLQYGISLDLEYKGFNLNVLGMGYGKYDRLLNTSYYQIYENRKYSNVVIDGLPNGNPHPQLSAIAVDNNFVSSDYWIVDGSFFKLRNVELGYTLPHRWTEKAGINTFKLFTRGNNLMTFSKIKDLDPENLNAGIGNFPLSTTYTLGVSVSF